jgi:hypothetical protein
VGGGGGGGDGAAGSGADAGRLAVTARLAGRGGRAWACQHHRQQQRTQAAGSSSARRQQAAAAHAGSRQQQRTQAAGSSSTGGSMEHGHASRQALVRRGKGPRGGSGWRSLAAQRKAMKRVRMVNRCVLQGIGRRPKGRTRLPPGQPADGTRARIRAAGPGRSERCVLGTVGSEVSTGSGRAGPGRAGPGRAGAGVSPS